MDLSISIVSWNTQGLLDACLRSIYETTTGIEFEVIVVDNASSDGSPEMVRRQHTRVQLIENSDNVGFARANNQAYAVSTGRHFLLLNPDTVVRPDALASLVRFLDEHDAAGAVGPLVLNSDETLQYSWARFPTFWSEVRGILDRRIAESESPPKTADETRSLGPFEADWVGGCCLMIKRAAVEQIGTMDESLFMYCEETDWCMRLKSAGWRVWVEPVAEIMHYGGQSSALIPYEATLALRRSKSRYFAKHHGLVVGAALGAALGLKSHARSLFVGRPWRI
jgi:hypothetical protein